MAPLNIAIIGAGVGGPAAAIGLARNGHKVTVYERASSTDQVGYAFRITPNSDRCLKWLGIDVRDRGAVVANTMRAMSFKGEIIRETRENEDKTKSQAGAFVFAYRVRDWPR